MKRISMMFAVAAVISVLSAQQSAAADYQYSAAGREAISNFLLGTHPTHPGSLLSSSYPRAAAVVDAACRQEAEAAQSEARWGSSPAAQRVPLAEIARALAAANQRNSDCRLTAQKDISLFLSGVLLNHYRAGRLSSSVYLGFIRGDRNTTGGGNLIDGFCANSTLTQNSGACRRFFSDQLSLIDHQQNPDGYIGAPRQMPIGVRLFGPQSGETGLAWTLLGAFQNGNTVTGPGRGGAVPTGRR